jgi:hypothetical protein
MGIVLFSFRRAAAGRGGLVVVNFLFRVVLAQFFVAVGLSMRPVELS